MSLFPDEDVLTKEIETWRIADYGFIADAAQNDQLLDYNLLNGNFTHVQ